MARTAKLKVYRTAIGFHDAYVAATSQKAALSAWGSDKDLFARGAAELVTDDALAAEPLASPGKVVRKLRGTAAEQLAALAPDRPKRKQSAGDDDGHGKAVGRRAATTVAPAPSPSNGPARQDRTAKIGPRPSRAALDAAEAAVAVAEQRHTDRLATLRRQEQELARQRRDLQAQQEQELEDLTGLREKAESDYGKALAKWRAEAG